MDVETSFDLERDKCLKILLMFFSASRAKGKKNKKIKEWEIKQTTGPLHVWTWKKKLTLEKISKAPTLGPFYFNLVSPQKLRYLSIRFPVFPSLLICVQKF